VTSPWRFLTADSVGAAEGLAFDEALMAPHARGRQDEPTALRLYTYASDAALCGRYQHLEAEIDTAACLRNGAAFNRRPTGGGAIVMGAGQLGVAVVTRAPARERPKTLLLRYASGIVAGLARLGIEARFGGKNDLKVGERKIAGLGLYLDADGALLFHSSILADLDIPFMLDVLRIPAAKLGDRATGAVSRRVTTVTAETGRQWKGAELRDVIAAGFSDSLGASLVSDGPTDMETETARALVASKYATEEWLHQQRPQQDATGTAVLKTPEGLLRVYLALHGEIIKSALFTGDFNVVPGPLARFEARLKWAQLDERSVTELAAECCSGGTGLGIEADDLAQIVVDAGKRARRPTAAIPDRSGSCYFPETDLVAATPEKRSRR
jgi:lipoate-protein ligase A